jgi:hypothetical protein
MKRTNIFNKLVLFSSFSFLVIVAIFVGCQKDFTAMDSGTTDSAVKSTSASKYQKWFEAYTSKPENSTFAINENFKGKIEPTWDKAVQLDSRLLELPFKLDGKNLSENISKSYRDGKISLVLRTNANGSHKGFVVAISPKNDYVGSLDDIHINNFKAKNFGGVISIYSLRGDYLDRFFIKNGRILRKSLDKSAQKNGANNSSLTMCCSENCEVIEAQWCTCLCTSGASSCNFATCTPPTCTTIWGGEVCTYDCYDCGDDCPDPSNPNCDDDCPNPNNPNCDDCPNPNNPNCDDGCGGCPGDDDDRIIENNLSPCNSAILAMILNSNTLEEMTDMIKFFQINDNNNFKISEERMFNQGGTQDMLTDATTLYNQNTNTYEVTLNTNVMENASKEYVAVTIMHEIIHAYMGAYWGTVRNNDTQHPLMVECYFVNLMANSLGSLFPNLSQYPGDAMALAWYGLDQTPSWDNFTILQKLEMQNINDAHKNRTNGTVPCQ